MNFHAAKWKNLEFVRSEGISKCFMLHAVFFYTSSYIAGACVEKYSVLENDSNIVTCCKYNKVSALNRMKIHLVLKKK